MYKFTFILLCIILSFYACNKSKSPTTPNEVTPIIDWDGGYLCNLYRSSNGTWTGKQDYIKGFSNTGNTGETIITIQAVSWNDVMKEIVQHVQVKEKTHYNLIVTISGQRSSSDWSPSSNYGRYMLKIISTSDSWEESFDTRSSYPPDYIEKYNCYNTFSLDSVTIEEGN